MENARDRARNRYGDDVLPGEGTSIGIIDTGIDLDHRAFDQERVKEVDLDRKDATESGFVPDHGTSVASVIAAQPGLALSERCPPRQGRMPIDSQAACAPNYQCLLWRLAPARGAIVRIRHAMQQGACPWQ